MKRYVKPLITGLITALLLVVVMWKITMNFQILLFFGFVLFFAAGVFNAKHPNNYLLTLISIILFYCTFFVLVVLSELPDIWYFVPFYAAGALLGLLYRTNKRKVIAGSVILLILMLMVAIKLIPTQLEDRLTQVRSDQLPEFTIQNINGTTTPSASLEGKIVVLDFFGTWCKPCILELKELDKVKGTFKEDEVVFYVINADQGGDTPEKFQAFIEKNNYNFNFAYDHNGEIFKQLKLHHLGLPTLLVIDKEQQIRLQHVGYNPAETNFRENLINTINELR